MKEPVILEAIRTPFAKRRGIFLDVRLDVFWRMPCEGSSCVRTSTRRRSRRQSMAA